MIRFTYAFVVNAAPFSKVSRFCTQDESAMVVRPSRTFTFCKASKTMRLTSQQQAALAARRLAHLIESAFVESTKPSNASAERSQ